MVKDKYHHGDLKQQLIENGLVILNEQGVEGFSLRKVASLCGVSHNAPYKHFKDKDELIQAIVKEVWKKFYLALSEVTELYSDNPKLQIKEMGKAYVRFMMENPEYLRFMFLSDDGNPIKISKGKFVNDEYSAFTVFRNSAERYLQETHIDEKLYMERTLAMWSLVHGIAIIIVKNKLMYDGDYLELVDKMINTFL